MAYQQYNNVRPQYSRYEQNEMNGDYNNKGFNNQSRNGFQYVSNNDYDLYNQIHRQEPISRGGFDMKPDSSVHSVKTCTSSGSFGIVKGNSPDFKCYECSKLSSQPEKVPFSFKNLQGIESIQPFMPKHLEKRNGFTMFHGQNEHEKDVDKFEEIKYEKKIEMETKKEVDNERKSYDLPLYVDVNTKYDIIPPELLTPIPTSQGIQNHIILNSANDYENKATSLQNNFHPSNNNLKNVFEHEKSDYVENKQEEIKNKMKNHILINETNVSKDELLENKFDVIQSSIEERKEIIQNIQEIKKEFIPSLVQTKVDVVQLALDKNKESDKIINETKDTVKVSNYIEKKSQIIDEDNFVRAHLTSENYEIFKSWLQTNCDKGIIRKIIETGYEIPEKIISLTIPTICRNRDLIVEIEDSPSKYISFLLPIIDDILKNNFINQSHEPIALILSSSKESVLKFSEITEKLIYQTSITFARCYGQYAFRQNLDELKRGCNILASTPGRLIHFLKSGDISLENIKYLIIDEVDKMIECGFHEIIANILNDYNCSTKENRVNIAAATKFSSVYNDLLCMVIKDTYTMVLKNTTGDLCDYKVKCVEGHISISELTKILIKHILEMRRKKSSGGISLNVDIPDKKKQTFSFNQV